MNRKQTLQLLLVFCALLPMSYGDDSRPSAVPSNQDAITFSNRAAHAEREFLKKFTPLVEFYAQKQQPSQKTGAIVVTSDIDVLGRLLWLKEPTIERLQERSHREASESQGNTSQILRGLLEVMVPDWAYVGGETYDFRFVEFTYLGAVHCAVYDVRPIDSTQDGFEGRLYFETVNWNLVRFTGMSSRADAMFSSLRAQDSRFRIDSWRTPTPKGIWVPSLSYVEEVPPLGSPVGAIWKGVISFWAYSHDPSRAGSGSTRIGLDGSPLTAEDPISQSCTPQECQRLFERQAEENVLVRLYAGGFLDAPGEVDKMLDQVLTNLVLSNSNLVLAQPLHCRILLLTGLEAFSIGNTIVVSRNLIDVVTTESGIARILAHQLAHDVLGHRQIDTRLAFADVLRIPDAELLAQLRFVHSAREEQEADELAMEILQKSPYQSKMADAELVMDALRARRGQLQALVEPAFGEHITDAAGIVDRDEMVRLRPSLDEDNPNQIVGLPLRSKLLVNPWDGTVEFVRHRQIPAIKPYERAPFAITAPMPYLTYWSEGRDSSQQAKALPAATVHKPNPGTHRKQASNRENHSSTPRKKSLRAVGTSSRSAVR